MNQWIIELEATAEYIFKVNAHEGVPGAACLNGVTHRDGYVVCVTRVCAPAGDLLVTFCLLCVSQVTEISMGEFLMHSSVVWLNPHSSLGRMRKDPEMTVFGESADVAVAFWDNASPSFSLPSTSTQGVDWFSSQTPPPATFPPGGTEPPMCSLSHQCSRKR